MSLVRIVSVKALDGFRIEATLTTGEVIQREIRDYLNGPVFASIRSDERLFREVRAEGGALVWPSGADLCPDLVIWGGLPPANSTDAAA